MTKQKVTFAQWLSNFQIGWFTTRRGEKVGTDAFGNTYYRDTKRKLHGRERRWVIYNGMPEASKVPPEWHGWLHHNMDQPLAADSKYHQPWVKPHQPNLTGTPEAYLPSGHQRAGGVRPAATGDYEAWSPDSVATDKKETNNAA